MTVGELIEKLQEYPSDTIIKVGGEYGMGDINSVDAFSFEKKIREIDGRVLVHMRNDLNGYNGEVHISND